MDQRVLCKDAKRQEPGPPDRNRTCIPRLGGMCTIHCATGRWPARTGKPQRGRFYPEFRQLPLFKEPLIKSNPFGLSLSNPLFLNVVPFDRLRANGINQCAPMDSADSPSGGKERISGALPEPLIESCPCYRCSARFCGQGETGKRCVFEVFKDFSKAIPLLPPQR